MLARVFVPSTSNLLKCIFRRDGFDRLLGKRIRIFQRLDDLVLAGQLVNRFGSMLGFIPNPLKKKYCAAAMCVTCWAKVRTP